MSQLKQKLYDPLKYRLDSFRFFIRKHLTKNLSSKYLFKKNSIKLTEIQNDILESIKKKGFAKSSLKELFYNGDQIFDNFLSIVESLKKTDDYKNSVNFFNENFDETGKHYIHRLNDNKNFKIDLNSYLINFILSNEILDIVNSYFELYAKLNTADLWITFLNKDKNKRTNAQRWHRDRDDVKILKVFLFLNDITENDGPTDYISYSRKKEKYAHLSKFSYGNIAPWKVYPKLETDKEVDENDIIKLIGNKGTLYFVDTTGMHRGGFSDKRDGERIFGYWSFLSPASVLFNKNFVKPDNVKLKNMKTKQRMAIV
jgi:hypothetical protein